MEPRAHEDEFNGMDESLNCGDANSTETQTIGDDLFTEEAQQSPFMNIFCGLQTLHQQLAYFRRHFGLVVSINS